MDTNRDDLSAFERRLAGWRPSDEGLDADAMLFAAGKEAGRPGRGRFAWPALSACLAVALVILVGWGMSERRERLALARQLELAREPAPEPYPDEGPSDYLSAHRALRQGLDAWPPRPVGTPHPGDAPTPPSDVLEAGQRNALIGP